MSYVVRNAATIYKSWIPWWWASRIFRRRYQMQPVPCSLACLCRPGETKFQAPGWFSVVQTSLSFCWRSSRSSLAARWCSTDRVDRRWPKSLNLNWFQTQKNWLQMRIPTPWSFSSPLKDCVLMVMQMIRWKYRYRTFRQEMTPSLQRPRQFKDQQAIIERRADFEMVSKLRSPIVLLGNPHFRCNNSVSSTDWIYFSQLKINLDNPAIFWNFLLAVIRH